MNQNQNNQDEELIKNWEKEFELLWQREAYYDGRYSPTPTDSKQDLHEKLSGVKHNPYPSQKFYRLIDSLLQAVRKEERGRTIKECIEEIKKYDTGHKCSPNLDPMLDGFQHAIICLERGLQNLLNNQSNE